MCVDTARIWCYNVQGDDMDYKFFAMVSRMKYINRWALMRNTINENISEHSLEVAFIAHALALLGNKRLGKSYNAERAALLAMYHDTTEIITGDLPTPIKYYNKQIKSVYNEIEENAERQMLSYLPEDLRGEYAAIFSPPPEDDELRPLVKAADKLSALIKCIEERRMGNVDFKSAEEATLAAIHKLECREAEIFLEEFIPSYDLTLDEQA